MQILELIDIQFSPDGYDYLLIVALFFDRDENFAIPVR